MFSNVIYFSLSRTQKNQPRHIWCLSFTSLYTAAQFFNNVTDTLRSACFWKFINILVIIYLSHQCKAKAANTERKRLLNLVRSSIRVGENCICIYSFECMFSICVRKFIWYKNLLICRPSTAGPKFVRRDSEGRPQGQDMCGEVGQTERCRRRCGGESTV